MTTTTNYGYNVVEGTDQVNIQTQIAPNFTAIDSDLKDVSDAAITTATHTLAGTVHQLVRDDADRAVIRFVATADMATGDTFTVDGVTVTARLVNGEALQTGAFKINNCVECILVGTVLNINAVNPAVSAASDVTYDNTVSGLTATDVQDAIDENAAQIATNKGDIYTQGLAIAANTAAIAAIVPGSKITELWSNADPTLPMSSGEQLILSSSNYDFLIITAAAECNVPNIVSVCAVASKGYGFSINHVILSTGSHITDTRRIFNYTNDTTITLTDGMQQTEGTARSVDNNRIVPMKVYGVKL